jgi:hypothetical protein
VFFFEKRKFLEKQVEDPGRQVSPAARKKQKKGRVQKTRKRRGTETGRPYVEGGEKDDCATRWW